MAALGTNRASRYFTNTRIPFFEDGGIGGVRTGEEFCFAPAEELGLRSPFDHDFFRLAVRAHGKASPGLVHRHDDTALAGAHPTGGVPALRRQQMQRGECVQTAEAKRIHLLCPSVRGDVFFESAAGWIC